MQITALDALAQSVGANRIVRGRAIVSVVGDAARSPAEERELREALVGKALAALTQPVLGPTVVV